MPKNIQTSEIHYKNVKLLKDLMSPSGRILPRVKTRLSAKQQRLLSRAVKRARHLALLPYTSLFE